MLGSDVMRGYNDMLILSLLAERDSYGYEISKEIEKRAAGAYCIKETTLYSAFGRLEKQGLVAAYQGSETQGRPRTYYTITDAGRQFFGEKCAEWQVLKRVVDAFAKEE
ncbi:PadR family transcriptional regulator [Butyricicoccus sp. Marseille-Q5471]|uniref:PadR family transcriptional regulator n=1 Tax=Butyricicoccus sp. Marseille-Q5471 TaxID=3039493 RepID=UPI0024BD491E|nr:PadR family transcriptional regulator [Butyricicoccus sp. Marseille-Q5471]